MAEFDPVKELGLCVLHIGINNDSAEEARAVAQQCHALLGFPLDEGEGSIFASSLIEIMKFRAPGTVGHIAIGAHDVDAAAAYFVSTGMGIREDTALYNEDGTMKFVYLGQEIAGFAIHLKQY